MKLEITKKEYDLIRNALENYYYICKDNGESRSKLNQITKLEEKLSKQLGDDVSGKSTK